MLKKVLSYGMVEAVSKGLNKLLVLLLPFLLSAESYGKIGIIISIEVLLPIITLLGLERAVLRFYGNNDDYKLDDFIPTILNSLKLTHIVFFVICAIMALAGVKHIFGIDLLYDVFLIILLVYFTCYNRIIILTYRVEDKHKEYYRANVLLQLGKFIVCLGLCLLLNTYIGYIVGSLIVSFIINCIYRYRGKSKGVNIDTFKYLFAFSWPFIFHGIAMNLLGNADKFIIQTYLSFEDVGQYTFAYSIGSMIFFAFIGISIYLEPQIYKSKNIEVRDLNIDKFIIAALVTAFVFYNLICLIAYYGIPRYYSEEYNRAILYVPYIGMSFLMYPFYLSSNYTLIYDKRTKIIASISIVSCIISLLLNVYFIPIYGVLGAIIINVVSYTTQILLFILVSNKFRLNVYFLENFIIGVSLILFVYFQVPFYFASALILIYLLYLFFVRGKVKIFKPERNV